jgi:hypothetical protein
MSFDTNFYYHLSNSFLGTGQRLDVVPDGFYHIQMANAGFFSGQFWKLVPVGPGKYALRTSFLGDSRSLDVVNDGTNTQLRMALTGNYSGQIWSFTPWGDGTFKLTNDFTGTKMSLDTAFEPPHVPRLSPGDHTGQHWTLTKTAFTTSGRIQFSAPIQTGGLAALGGSVQVTVNSNGSVRWQGHAHDSGLDGYNFGVGALVRTPSGRVIVLAKGGHVGGTITSGSRDFDWDDTQPPNPVIAANLDDYASAQFQTNLDYSSDISDAIQKIVSWCFKYGVGSLVGSVGTAVFVGVEVGSLVSTGSLVPGARLLGGVLWMAGPANTLFALAAEGIAALGSRTRELSQDEYGWANNLVFLGALPPRDRIVLTDTIAGGNRAFTFPRFDGKITLNMGPTAFVDPRDFPGHRWGETFIHELVHACQIQHANIDLAFLADAFATRVCEATGGNPYHYGAAGPDYSSFNLEEQAEIVSDWFAKYYKKDDSTDNHGLNSHNATNDPYFRYIIGNVRIGRF